MAVGVGGGVDINELHSIADNPDSANTFTVSNFDQLNSIAAQIVQRACSGRRYSQRITFAATFFVLNDMFTITVIHFTLETNFLNYDECYQSEDVWLYDIFYSINIFFFQFMLPPLHQQVSFFNVDNVIMS